MERKTKYILIAIITVICTILGVAYYQDVTTTWIIDMPNIPPEIYLDIPSDRSTIKESTLFFNWTSSDDDGDVLEHVWFIDLYPTMNSPMKIDYNTGQATNYSPISLLDGTWYWKVEVSDEKDVNTSETRTVIMKEYTSNHIPDILNYSVTDIIGGVKSVFYYLMTYQDIDNDSATVVKVYIDNIGYDMLEVDHSDSNYSDGKYYYYQTKLALGVHNYSLYVCDGYSVNTTPIIEKPIVVPDYNTLPEIILISPIPGEIFNTINVTFEWNITDAENNLDYYELWLWKSTEPKQVYGVPNGTTLQLTADTYYWQILAVDEYGQNTSEKRSFGVLATGKQCSATIQVDDTRGVTNDYFTGDLVVTNEGPLESYEIFWYVELWDKRMTDWVSRDTGALALTTTITADFKVSIPEDADGGTHYLRAFVYDSLEDGELIGYDEITVIIEIGTIILDDDDITWYSLIYDTPRYTINLEDYPTATRVKLPPSYDYSMLFFIKGTRPLKEVEVYLFSSGVFLQIPCCSISTTIYEFEKIDEIQDSTLVIVPNPSVTDCVWIYNWLHDNI